MRGSVCANRCPGRGGQNKKKKGKEKEKGEEYATASSLRWSFDGLQLLFLPARILFCEGGGTRCLLGLMAKYRSESGVWKAADVQQKPTNLALTILLTIEEGASDPPVCFPSQEAWATPSSATPLK